MSVDGVDPELQRLIAIADRLDDLAEVAELMGDGDGARRWRRSADARREEAVALLDRRPGPEPANGPDPDDAQYR